MQLPQFSVITPATDLTLLTPEELRLAAGLDPADTTRDAELSAFEASVTADIVADCAIASDGVNPPTLRSEGCQDVFRLDCPAKTLFLSRRHAAVASVEQDGTVLADTDWLLEAETGKLARLINDAQTCWTARKVLVVYTAGFAIVPSELKTEAVVRLRAALAFTQRDPLTRRIRTEIPDIELRDLEYYQAGVGDKSTANGMPYESERRLRRFMTQSMAY